MPSNPAYSIHILDSNEKNYLTQLLSLTINELNSKLLNEKNERPKWVVEQALRRKKIQDKLPTLFQNLDLILPPTLHLEQSSSEATAAFKATLFQGEQFIDFTAGMGIDSLYLSKQFKQGTLLELNSDLCELDAYNLNVLDIQHVKTLNTSCEDFLKTNSYHYDLGYIDPARRNEHGGRVVYISDYTPNVLNLRNDLLKKCKKVLLKTSPLLDIKKSIQDLEKVSDVYVVSVENECKELLFVLTQNAFETTNIHAVCIGKRTIQFTFKLIEEQDAKVEYALPQNYLYEADAAILKAGAFQQIAVRFGLKKLHKHTHLYTSEVGVPNFPGRVFSVEHHCKPDKKELLMHLPSLTINLSIRNFPMAVDALKKKLGVQDGGDWYAFACTLYDNSKRLILCKKA